MRAPNVQLSNLANQAVLRTNIQRTKQPAIAGAIGTAAATAALAAKIIGAATLAAAPIWPLAAAIAFFGLIAVGALALRALFAKELANSYSPENSVWVEDWSANLDTAAFIQALPNGVDTINIFVGQLDLVNGAPTIDGFSEDTPNRPAGTGAFPNVAAVTDFIAQCKKLKPGLKIKISIGGQAGTVFGNSWNNLNSGNVGAFAQALADFCKTTGADGVDFDNELEDTNIAALSGQLAAQVKTLNPVLDLSYCAFAGINQWGPEHQTNAVFLQNTMSNGISAIDRVAVMSYYDGWTQAQNQQAMTYWNQWLKQNCGMAPAQLSCGVDPNDPNTSPKDGSLTTWIDFAAQNGFGTAIWDQQGSNDYIANNWGEVIQGLYKNEGSLPEGIVPETIITRG